jgi:hypothetical protein
MDWIDKILGNKEIKKEKVVTEKPVSLGKMNSKGAVEIHNHLHLTPPPSVKESRPKQSGRSILSALDSHDNNGNIINPFGNTFPSVKDSDGDGVPDIMDKEPFNPNVPKPVLKQSKKVDSILNSMFGGD